VERTSGTFLALGDDAYDSGFGLVPQIAELRLYGMTEADANGGVLFGAILDGGSPRFEIRNLEYGSPYETAESLVAWVSLSGYTINSAAYLQGGPGHPHVCGKVVLREVIADTTLQLMVPQSTVNALVAGSEAYLISEVELHGITAANSYNGVLEWEMNVDDPDFTITFYGPGNVAVASASGLIASYAPLRCALSAENASGISGTVVLEGFEPGSGYAAVRLTDGIRIAALGDGSASHSLSVDKFGCLRHT
jgi:hypothetical protein